MFSDTERGVLQGIIPFFVYVLPVVTGALGDRLGYRRMFLIAIRYFDSELLFIGTGASILALLSRLHVSCPWRGNLQASGCWHRSP